MKNSIKALLLASAMAICMLFAACTNGEGQSESTTTAVSVQTSATTEQQEKTEAPETKSETESASSETESPNQDLWSGAAYTKDAEVGEGDKTITVKVVIEDKSVTITVHTNQEMLGGALTENKLVDGENSEYGLYIKSVIGIEADYDKNQAYWAISKGGEYLMTGADTTPIANGESYELTYTKG